MSGMGRGRLLQHIMAKKKEEEEQKKQQQQVEEEEQKKQQQQEARIAQKAAEEQPPSPPKLPLRSIGRGMLRNLIASQTVQQQRVASISPSRIEEKQREEEKHEQVSRSTSAVAARQSLYARGRGIITRIAAQSASLPPGATTQRPTTSTLKTEKFPTVVQSTSQFEGSSASEERARLSTTTTTSTSTEKKTQYMSVAMSETKSIESSMRALKVEHIMRRSPVRRVGEAGKAEPYSTNYIKLKYKNKGVYQYIVNYDPPIDSQYIRIKLLHGLAAITGNVRLFDGYTLFLPILLDNLTETTVERTNGDKVNIRIQLTKILPPEKTPPQVFNIIFKKYA